MTNCPPLKITCLLFVLVVIVVGEAQQSCSVLHEKCVFIVAVGLSGSTSLMDILNQHPDVHIRGENSGLFNDVIMSRMQEMKWQLDYNQTIKDKNWKQLEKFTSVSYEKAYEGVGQMFKHQFGHGEDKNKIVGFKEIRIFNEQQVNFLRGLCQKSKVLFQFSKKVDEVAHKDWYGYNPAESRRNIINKIKFFRDYYLKYPNITYVSTIEDFKRPDFVADLFKFLGLSLEGLKIDTGRLYRQKSQAVHNRG